MSPSGELEHYTSSVDGEPIPYAVCATSASDEPKPLILEVSPGAIRDLDGSLRLTEEIAGIAARNGRDCVVLRPTGRGPGSLYQNYGEVDVLEAIEAVARRYAIDRDRITITGASMGGAATWYLISHYPDLFAAAAPFCGYCDYRLWEKPGGLTFRAHDWEEPSWRARSAAFLVENLRHTPVWIVHGEWDRGVGGGVPVAHSRQMAERLDALGFEFIYTEVPATGHGCRLDDIWEQVILWLLARRKKRHPGIVSLVTCDLRHNRSHWVAIEQLDRYGRCGSVDARLGEGEIAVKAEGVRTLTLGPLPRDGSVLLTGKPAGNLPAGETRTFRRATNGTWNPILPDDLAGEKRHGCSGPIGDLFHDPLLLVPGTTGTQEETFFNSWVASDARGYYRSRNGGVHRGGIMGENSVDLRLVNDVDVGEESMRANNLLLYGTPSTNGLLARYRDRVPVSFDRNEIRLAGESFSANGVAVFAIFPHPENSNRCLAVHGGSTPDAICWGSHLDMHLLPDYLVYARGEVLEWGFWNNEWKR